jgi:uncharacterized membrane protein YfcA
VVAFSALAALALIIVLGVLRPHGLHHDNTVQAPAATETLASSEITWKHAPALFLTGLCAGLLSGLLGMGGGVLKIAFMLLFLRLDIFFARAVSLVTMFFSSSSALWSYFKAGLFVWPVALRMLTIAVPAVLLAAFVGNDVHAQTLTTVFAIFMLFLSFNTFAFVLGDPEERVMTHVPEDDGGDKRGYLSATIGAFHGFACGLLGISGGVVATPMQQLILRMPMRHAIANTLLVSAVVTAIAGAIVVTTGVQRGTFTLAEVIFVDLCMGFGATVGAQLGTRLGEQFNVTALRMLFVVLTFGAGLSILL